MKSERGVYAVNIIKENRKQTSEISRREVERRKKLANNDTKHVAGELLTVIYIFLRQQSLDKVLQSGNALHEKLSQKPSLFNWINITARSISVICFALLFQFPINYLFAIKLRQFNH